MWNIETGQQISLLEAHASLVYSVAFLPDGKTLVAGSNDRTIKLWNVETGQQVKSLEDAGNSAFSVAFSPNGKTIASGSENKTIKLWSIETGQPIKSLEGHRDSVSSVAFSPDGKILASGSLDRTIKLWNVETGQQIKSLEGHSNWVQSVAFSPDGKMLASGSEDKTIRLWSVETGQQIKSLESHTDLVLSVAFSPDGKILASGSRDKKVKLWNVETGEQIKSLEGHSSLVCSVAFSPDSKTLASGSYDATMKLWNVRSGKSLATLTSLDRNDWIVVTSEGYFDGSPNAWKLLLWRLSPQLYDFVSVEAFFKEFYYPGLLQEIMEGKTPRLPVQDLSTIDIRQPALKIAEIDGKTTNSNNVSTNKQTVKVRLEITDNQQPERKIDFPATSGAQDLRLFRNGSLVKIWRKETNNKQMNSSVFDLTEKDGCRQTPAAKDAPRRAVCETEIRITTGENELTAYAFNHNDVKSADASVVVEGKFAKRDGTLYVLAVGVNKYANSAYNLNFAVPDVEEIGVAVKSQQDKLAQDKQLKQYGKTEIITLTNENATRENILLALSRFSKDGAANKLPENLCANITNNQCAELKAEFTKIKPTEPEDALIIYYAGHSTSRGQRFYLLPHNFTGKGGEKLLEEQGVSDIDLNNYLEKVDAGRLLTVIDACQSGQALGEKTEGRGPMNSKGLAQLAYDKGMLILTAARSQQSALEVVKIGGKEVRHGLLTYALLEAMKNPLMDADKDGNKQIWEREWFDFATEKVPIFQLQAMKERRVDLQKGAADSKGRSEIIYLGGDDPNLDPEKRRVQTPRVFYRRETEINPLIVAKP